MQREKIYYSFRQYLLLPVGEILLFYELFFFRTSAELEFFYFKDFSAADISTLVKHDQKLNNLVAAKLSSYYANFSAIKLANQISQFFQYLASWQRGVQFQTILICPEAIIKLHQFAFSRHSGGIETQDIFSTDT